MIIHKCDICGKELGTWISTTAMIGAMHDETNVSNLMELVGKHELCPECTRKVSSYIRDMKEGRESAEKVYLVEKLYKDHDDETYDGTEEIYIFGSLDKAEKFVGEQVTEIRERFHYDLNQVYVDEAERWTYIGDYDFFIKEREVQ